MANRLSNRERIERRALEVAAREKEKEEKKAEKKAAKKPASGGAKKKTRTGTKKEAAPRERLTIVWTVFDDRLKELASFPYPQKDAAEAKAAALTQKSGRQHVVRPNKVPTSR